MNTLTDQALLETLQARFEKHRDRHPGLSWSDVGARLAGATGALRTLREMEATGGEPDVIGGPDSAGGIAFYDCAAESPIGRRSLCYDRAAWEARKEARPSGSADEMAAAMGIELLSEGAYRDLQAFGSFDTKTSSWIRTPADVRAAGGAMFCDRRYGRVFTYHNGAQSYYAARGFRGLLRV